MCEEKGNTEEKPIIAVTENTELAEQTETTAESVQPMRKCLNCGTLSNGNFCPNCGQSMSVGRVKHKSLFRQFLCSFLRLDPVFLKTLGLLIVKPWKVIKDYLDGHQICYTQPVTTLVFIFFFRTILSLIMGASSGASFKDIWATQYPEFTDGQMLVIKMGQTLLFIDIIKLMLSRLPLILAIKLVYNRTDGRRYTWAEYMTASVYLLSSVTACSIVTDLFIAPFSSEDIADLISMAYSLVIIFLTVQHIFPCKNIFKAAVKYIFSVLLGFVLFMIYIVTIVIVVLGLLYTIEPSTMEKLLETGTLT
ncbi:MAG: DUF3667 domain-containing protein [Bacteroidales bacterium]|nr:DUF3667 domain-containing protein [Bacteroidales bacterium]